MDTALSAAVTELLKLGFAGAVIVVLYLLFKERDQNFRESQEKRLTENQSNTEKFLTALNASTEQTRAHVTAVNQLTEAFKAMTAGYTALGAKFDEVVRFIQEGGKTRGGRSK